MWCAHTALWCIILTLLGAQTVCNAHPIEVRLSSVDGGAASACTGPPPNLHFSSSSADMPSG